MVSCRRHRPAGPAARPCARMARMPGDLADGHDAIPAPGLCRDRLWMPTARDHPVLSIGMGLRPARLQPHRREAAQCRRGPQPRPRAGSPERPRKDPRFSRSWCLGWRCAGMSHGPWSCSPCHSIRLRSPGGVTETAYLRSVSEPKRSLTAPSPLSGCQ